MSLRKKEPFSGAGGCYDQVSQLASHCCLVKLGKFPSASQGLSGLICKVGVIVVTTCWERACVRAKSLQPYRTLCDPMDCSPPGSSVHRISQARILEWVAISFCRRSSQPRDWTASCTGRWILYHWATRRAPPPLISSIFLALLPGLAAGEKA